MPKFAMKKLSMFVLAFGAIGVLLIELQGPYRLRRLDHNFDFVQTQMMEEQVSQVLGEKGEIQPCTGAASGQCDHELVFHLRGANSLVVDINKSGRVIRKARLP